MVSAKEIIDAITNLDLSKYPHDKVLLELRKIEKAGLVMNTLHTGYEVIRVRPNYNGERFSNVKELSYKPQEFNKTYQRGSTPNKTMFYGSSTQKDIPGASATIGRETAIRETIPKLRDPNAEFEQLVTISKWTVTEDINLAAICYDKEMHQNFPDHKYVYEVFEKYLDSYPDYKARTLEINSFLAKEFSNPEPSSEKDFLYLPSAIYTEMVSEFHFEGVTYPSVRTIGFGINVAITPKATEKLVCSAVGEALVIKKKNQGAIVENMQTIILNPGQLDFKFEP